MCQNIIVCRHWIIGRSDCQNYLFWNWVLKNFQYCLLKSTLWIDMVALLDEMKCCWQSNEDYSPLLVFWVQWRRTGCPVFVLKMTPMLKSPLQKKLVFNHSLSKKLYTTLLNFRNSGNVVLVTYVNDCIYFNSSLFPTPQSIPPTQVIITQISGNIK